MKLVVSSSSWFFIFFFLSPLFSVICRPLDFLSYFFYVSLFLLFFAALAFSSNSWLILFKISFVLSLPFWIFTCKSFNPTSVSYCILSLFLYPNHWSQKSDQAAALFHKWGRKKAEGTVVQFLLLLRDEKVLLLRLLRLLAKLPISILTSKISCCTNLVILHQSSYRCS